MTFFQKNTVTRRFFTGAILLTAVIGISVPNPAQADIQIQEVQSPGGIAAWLMEDSNDEMISLSFAFHGGSILDPEGKEGLTGLMTNLITSGAGDLDRDAFQQAFYETGARLSFSNGLEGVSGRLSVLPDEMDEPLKLLKLALTSPRFDQEDIDRARGVVISSLADRQSDPDWLGRDKFARAIYGDHPVVRDTTAESISAITREDLFERKNAVMTRENLVVGVAGNITPERLGMVLDTLFSALPEGPRSPKLGKPDPVFGLTMHQAYDRPQTAIRMVYPGVARNSDDIYAATVLTQLVGGGMTSRLFMELREKRGLTYGVGTSGASYEDWGVTVVTTSTRAETAQEALGITKSVLQDIANGDISQVEVDQAKSYLQGSIVISSLASTSSISRTLSSIQLEGKSINYLDELRQHYGDVTLDQVKAVAAKLFSTEPSVLTVGQ